MLNSLLFAFCVARIFPFLQDGDKAWPTLLAIGKRLDAASDHSRLLCLLHMLMLFDESFR